MPGLIIAFITSATAVLETVTEKRLALLPHEVRKNGFDYLGGVEPVITAFDTSRGKTVDDLLGWLNWRNASGVMLLTDDTLSDLVRLLGDQFNVHRFTPPAYNLNPDNQLRAMIAKCLRSYRYLATRFSDAKYQQIFRLPLRNFVAADTERMQVLCRDMTQRNYGREIDALLRDMRKRQFPKRASDHYEDLYYVDDDKKHFRLGLERHARAETAIPPHNVLCTIANCFRFGQHFDGAIHYNVSRDGDSIVGIYTDCHGVNKQHTRPTHINMFTNDFF